MTWDTLRILGRHSNFSRRTGRRTRSPTRHQQQATRWVSMGPREVGADYAQQRQSFVALAARCGGVDEKRLAGFGVGEGLAVDIEPTDLGVLKALFAGELEADL